MEPSISIEKVRRMMGQVRELASRGPDCANHEPKIVHIHDGEMVEVACPNCHLHFYMHPVTARENGWIE